uniref:Uncharacterized protein n=1 Tax=Moniliophthora roreri TaxID=221103 RepID=A0A0W0FQ66_MONRR
MQESGVLM